LTVGSDANAQYVHHYRYSGAQPTPADCATIASAIAASYNSHLAAYAPATTILTNTIVTDLASSTGKQGNYASSWAGSRTGAAMDASCSLIVGYSSPLRYRGGHPRTYFSLGTVADLANPNSWNPAFINAVGPALVAFFASVVGTTISGGSVAAHSYVQYYQGHTYQANPPYHKIPTRLNPPVQWDVGAATPRQVPGNQRRRLRPG
jgi:hypothetical protein